MSRNYDNFADLITFSRASTATFVGSNGLIQSATTNTPRIDFDPVTGDRKGLLIEEARTNLIPYSENFDQGAWFKNNLTVSADSATAPDGTSNADKIISDSGLSGYIFEGVSITSGNDYTHTVFAKSGEFTSLRVLGQTNAFGANIYVDFDLSAGTVGSVTGGSGTASIEDFGSGWYRCVLTLAATATVTSGFQIRPVGTGDGSSGVYVFGAQIEVGSFPTSYIPTSGSTVTRSADVATIATSAFGFNEDEGTFFVEGETSDDAGSLKVFAYLSETGYFFTDRIYLSSSVSETMKMNVESNNVETASIVSGSGVEIGKYVKLAGAYQKDNFGFITSEGALSTDTSGDVPREIAMKNLSIGNNPFNTTNMLNGHIKKLQYFPRRLSDTELQEITS